MKFINLSSGAPFLVDNSKYVLIHLKLIYLIVEKSLYQHDDIIVMPKCNEISVTTNV